MKTLAGTIGFMMLFGIPSEQALDENAWRAMGLYLVWLAAAVALLAYGGAFKRNLSTKK
jgi:hypothetical protein